MKQVFSVLIMVLSLLIGFQQAIIVMHFKLNQEAIEQAFCINKSQPKLQCHGTCHLKKRLQETENTNQSSISMYQKVDMLPFSFIGFKAINSAIEIGANIPFYQEVFYVAPCREIFVPPKAI